MDEVTRKLKGKTMNVFQNHDFMPPEKEEEGLSRFDTKRIPPGSIIPRHFLFGTFPVLSSETRPDEGNEFAFHFNPTTGVFSAWNGSAWKTVTLT